MSVNSQDFAFAEHDRKLADFLPCKVQGVVECAVYSFLVTGPVSSVTVACATVKQTLRVGYKVIIWGFHGVVWCGAPSQSHNRTRKARVRLDYLHDLISYIQENV